MCSNDKSERNKVAEKQAADTREPKNSTNDKKRPSIMEFFEHDREHRNNQNSDETNNLDNNPYHYQQRQLNNSQSMPIVQISEHFDIDTALEIAEQIVNHQQQQQQNQLHLVYEKRCEISVKSTKFGKLKWQVDDIADHFWQDGTEKIFKFSKKCKNENHFFRQMNNF